MKASLPRLLAVLALSVLLPAAALDLSLGAGGASVGVRSGRSSKSVRSWDGKGFRVYNWQKVFSETSSPIIIQLPSEPGLYYFGYYDALKTEANGTLTEDARHPSASMKRTALRAALECYKGTAWEKAIRAELDRR